MYDCNGLHQHSTHWLSINFYILEIVYSSGNMHTGNSYCFTPGNGHFVVYRALSQHFRRPLHAYNTCVWWLAFCKFYMTCRISVSQVRNKGFSFNIVFKHFRVGVKTLQTQDTSDPRHFGTIRLVPKCPDSSAPVPKCLSDTSALVSNCLESRPR